MMEKKPQENKISLLAALFNPKELGESLKEVAVDVVKANNQQITSHWFHSSKDADFYIWRDQSRNIIKQQITFFGQVVEWNVIEGVRTGFLLEDETTSKDPTKGVIVRYDSTPQKQAIEQGVEVIAAIVGLRAEDKLATIQNFIRPRHWFAGFLRKIGFKK